MSWLVFAFIALGIGITKELVKKRILDRIEPIVFVFFFYTAMFIMAQATLPFITLPSLEVFGLIILTSVFYCFANLFGLRALQEMRISIFKPISGLSSILVLFFAFLFLNETITVSQAMAILLVLGPIIYFAYHEYEKKEMSMRNMLYLGAAMLFEAGAVIVDRVILKSIDTLTFFYFLKLVLIIMLGLLLVFYYKQPINKKLLKKNTLPIILLAFATMLGAYSYFFALQDPQAITGIVKTIISSSIVFTTLLGGIYLKEKQLLPKVVVSIVSLVGLILLIFV